MPTPLKNESVNVNFADGISMFTQITTMGGNFIGGDLGSYTPYPVSNPKMKLVLQDCSYYSLNYGHGPGTIQLKAGRGHGQCTNGPTTWYGRAGIHWLTWWGGYSPARPDKCTLGNYGFKKIWSGTGYDADKYLGGKPTIAVRPGDIATLFPGHSQHAVMWTGYDWRSDFIQRKCWCYGSGHERYGNQTVILWRHPDFQ